MKDQLFNRKILFSLLAVVMCLGLWTLSKIYSHELRRSRLQLTPTYGVLPSENSCEIG